MSGGFDCRHAVANGAVCLGLRAEHEAGFVNEIHYRQVESVAMMHVGAGLQSEKLGADGPLLRAMKNRRDYASERKTETLRFQT